MQEDHQCKRIVNAKGTRVNNDLLVEDNNSQHLMIEKLSIDAKEALAMISYRKTTTSTE